jgi:hypothetical protein
MLERFTEADNLIRRRENMPDTSKIDKIVYEILVGMPPMG